MSKKKEKPPLLERLKQAGHETQSYAAGGLFLASSISSAYGHGILEAIRQYDGLREEVDKKLSGLNGFLFGVGETVIYGPLFFLRDDFARARFMQSGELDPYVAHVSDVMHATLLGTSAVAASAAMYLPARLTELITAEPLANKKKLALGAPLAPALSALAYTAATQPLEDIANTVQTTFDHAVSGDTLTWAAAGLGLGWYTTTKLAKALPKALYSACQRKK